VLSDKELVKLVSAVQFCYNIPFIDDVEDFIFESIWSYVKEIRIDNPLSRTKRLFDVVDPERRIGWSAKTLVLNSEGASECEFVIQRADVFKKGKDLGFPGLQEKSKPQEIGNAVLEHWRLKVEEDAKIQEVNERRLVLLLKNNKRTRFRLIEDRLHVPMSNELTWSWTNEQQIGLQATRKSDSFVVFRWYKNQKQLFERIKIQSKVPSFEVSQNYLSPDVLIKHFKNLGY